MESNSLQWKVVLATIGIIGRYKPNTVWASGYLTAILIIVDKGYILSGRGLKKQNTFNLTNLSVLSEGA